MTNLPSLATATAIKLVGDAAARPIDARSLTEREPSYRSAWQAEYVWTQTAAETTTTHFAPRHAVIEIVF